MTTSSTETGARRDRMTKYYDFARHVGRLIKQAAAENNVSTRMWAHQVLDDADLKNEIYDKALPSADDEKISMQDMTNIINCVASGEIEI